MTAIVYTMVFNEAENVERWVKYYSEQLGSDAVLIVDNASDDESVPFIRKQRNLLYPKMTFSNNVRAAFLSSLASAFLNLYETVIYTDVDEFIVANPAKYENLASFLRQNPADAYACLGFDLVHILGLEEECPKEKPLLRYHRHVKPLRSMCKTLITRKPIRWGGGFHTSDAFPEFHKDLWLFHTKSANYEQRFRRQAITRKVVRDDNSGTHQRWDDDMLNTVFESFRKEQKFPFTDDVVGNMYDTLVNGGIERKYFDQIDLIKYSIKSEASFGRGIFKLDDAFPDIF